MGAEERLKKLSGEIRYIRARIDDLHGMPPGGKIYATAAPPSAGSLPHPSAIKTNVPYTESVPDRVIKIISLEIDLADREEEMEAMIARLDDWRHRAILRTLYKDGGGICSAAKEIGLERAMTYKLRQAAIKLLDQSD